MKYKKAREIMKSGDIIVYNNDTLFGKVIRYVLKEKATHVAVALWVGERLFVIEALEGKGVIIELASKRFKKGNIVDVRRRKQNITEKTVQQRALNELGSKYDWYINFGLFLKKKLGLKVQINHINRFNCSEFGGYVNNLNNTYVSPGDLLKSEELISINTETG